MNKNEKRLARGELQILEMLWREGPVSISEAHEALGLPIGYTTVQTRLNRLVEKRIVKKSKSRPAKYEAIVTQEQIVESDLDTLLKRVSSGKVVPLVAHLVQDRDLSQSELQAIRELIDHAEAALDQSAKLQSPKPKTPKRKPVPRRKKP